MTRVPTEEQRKAKNAYNRAYYAANRERVRKKGRERWAKKAERVNAERRAKRAQDPEAARAYMREWYARNRESTNEVKRAWRAKNAERINAKRRAKYAAATPEERKARAEKVRARRQAHLTELSEAENAERRKHNAKVMREWRWRTGRTPEANVSARYLPEFRYGEYAEAIESAREKLNKWYNII